MQTAQRVEVAPRSPLVGYRDKETRIRRIGEFNAIHPYATLEARYRKRYYQTHQNLMEIEADERYELDARAIDEQGYEIFDWVDDDLADIDEWPEDERLWDE